MEIWLWVVIVTLICVVFGLSAKLFFIHKAAKEIETGLSERLTTDTNTLIDISSRDRCMKKLASAVNIQLRKLRQERHCFQQGNVELKNAIINISHDLRTPLTAISGYLDLLDDVEKNEDIERYIEIIKERTEILKQHTEELFQYSMITLPEYNTATELVCVNSILEESILGFYAVLQEHRIIPDIQITEKKVIRRLNREALSRVFSNLINNAVKYSDGDLKIVLTDTGEITFSNRAAGLSKIQVERLFERFYTVENARKSTGLGLSISRVLMEQMQGTIYAKYEDKKLSIYVQLPNISE